MPDDQDRKWKVDQRPFHYPGAGDIEMVRRLIPDDDPCTVTLFQPLFKPCKTCQSLRKIEWYSEECRKIDLPFNVKQIVSSLNPNDTALPYIFSILFYCATGI